MCGHVSPFERNYGIRHIFGPVYLNVRFRDWLRLFWQHPEADVFWYCVGPITVLRQPW